MLLTETQNQLLAVLFAAGHPLPTARLADALEKTESETDRAVEDLSVLLREMEFPLQLRRLEQSWQLCSSPVYAELIRRTLELGRAAPLSSAALEVLAIIAYNQPVTKSFVEQIRGVDSSGVVNSLLEKGLLEEAGRLELPGRPIAYRTTAGFLRCFGLESLEQLPAVGEEEELPPEDPEEDGQLDFSMLSEQ